MYLVLQHPFADLRSFLGDECGRLPRPMWPSAQPETDFVRSSGLVKIRRRGGVKEWAGEELYGDASLAFRFPNHLGEARFQTDSIESTVSNVFRRYYSEGTVARLEVGLRLNVKVDASTATAKEWLQLLRDLLEIPVCVRNTKQQNLKIKLVEAGDTLAQHYLAATTNRQFSPQVKPKPWWFCSGNPTLIVEYSHSQPLTLPPYTQRVLNVLEADATLSHTWLQFGKHRCSTWFVAIGKGDPDAVRRLRIHLARLHNERECLRLVLLHIKDNDKLGLAKNLARSDAVQQYLNNSLKAIQKPKRFGISQSVVFNAAQQALGIAFEGHATSLRFIRQQVAAKVDGYILRAQSTSTVINNIQGDVMNTNIQLGNVNVTGDFNLVTATNIQNSFNKAANAEIDTELKEKLKAIAVEVAKLAEKLSPDDAEKVSKDLESLTSEVVSKIPRKEWYELSAKGIVEAAKTVAEMAAPVTAAVNAVLALLAL